MDHIGMDVHKRESQICILTEPERFAAVLGDTPRARILLEAATESKWVARCLEALGHEVVVADPNFAPMYATRTRKVKTDRRDARALVEACLLRPAPRARPPARPGRLLSQIAPLLAVMRQVNHQLVYSEHVIEDVTAHDERVQRLRTVPSIGPVTAAARRHDR